ncbi:uncharacterized protein [Choristoneura fumiferana]|uniref:uncharacterized protein n=1 Tax=Choristoneura fumiferana TaxID=7141 RepID=UPI003D15DE71
MPEHGQTKQEAPWEGVTDAAKREGLYEEHEIQGEMVIGPEVLQPQDVAFALPTIKPKLNSGRSCNTETSSFVVKPKAVWANRECLQDNSPTPTSTATCSKQIIDKELHSTQANQEEIKPETDMCSGKNCPSEDNPFQCEDSSESSQKPYSTRLKKTSLVKNHLTCEICSKKFSEKNNFISHMKNHTGQQSFRCDICKKRFVSCKNLWNHKQMHAGDTPYSCEMCPKQFSHKSYLNSHKQIHATNKPHDCDVCGKQFLSKYQLNTHKQCHVNEKPYSCKNCKKEFASNSYFIKHIWTCKK